MKKLQAMIAKWQQETFGVNKTHWKGLLNHLHKEYIELENSTYDHEAKEMSHEEGIREIRKELADCVILLIGLADAYDIDLDKAVKDKMQENFTRTWKKPDKNGVIEHETT